MHNHLNAFIGLALGFLFSLLIIFFLWDNYKTISIISIILIILIPIIIGDYFDKKKLKQTPHLRGGVPTIHETLP